LEQALLRFSLQKKAKRREAGGGTYEYKARQLFLFFEQYRNRGAFFGLRIGKSEHSK
jgi:hypothetical protein